jgi:G3E family GTPase
MDQRLTQQRGPDILRLKGIIAFPDEPKRFVVQGVHMIIEGDTQRDWREDASRASRASSSSAAILTAPNSKPPSRPAQRERASLRKRPSPGDRRRRDGGALDRR